MKKIFIVAASFFSLSAFAQKEKVSRYIQAYKDMAIAEMHRSGVPASITLAQGILESQSGESMLATKANNHFGIKCKTEWTGEKIYKDDDEKGECFRVYPSAAESYKDHSDFLKFRPYYAELFKLDIADYEGWAKGLKKAGYATDPAYPQKLIKLIEENNLHSYTLLGLTRQRANEINTDKQSQVVTEVTPSVKEQEKKQATVQVEPFVQTKKEMVQVQAVPNSAAQIGEIQKATIKEEPIKEANPVEEDKTEKKEEVKAPVSAVSTVNYPATPFQINETKVLYAKAGTSLLAIADAYEITLARLIEYNDLKGIKDILSEDQLIYLEKKQKRSNKDFHIVQAKETWWQISQQEGITLKSLMDLNKVKTQVPLAVGEKLHLRSDNPANVKTASK